jgi:hypothetical protein
VPGEHENKNLIRDMVLKRIYKLIEIVKRLVTDRERDQIMNKIALLMGYTIEEDDDGR